MLSVLLARIRIDVIPRRQGRQGVSQFLVVLLLCHVNPDPVADGSFSPYYRTQADLSRPAGHFAL
jgi:hypothetical protein